MAENEGADLPAGMDVVVLAGGLGTRLRGVLADTPKVLAPVDGRPFLDHLLDHLARQGAGRVILALGYLAERVIEHLERTPPVLPVLTVVEPTPLGTAGALRLVLPQTAGPAILVMNGDSWMDADLGRFVAHWRRSGRDGAMVAVQVEDVASFGTLAVSDAGDLLGFAEKASDRHGPGLINAGAYLFGRDLLDRLDAFPGPSLEHDVLERLPAGTLAVHISERAGFIDIGTPERLARAGVVLGGGKRLET